MRTYLFLSHSTIVFLLGILALTGCNMDHQNPEQQVPDPLGTRIDSICESLLGDGETVGFSVAVVRDGETLYKNAFGHADSARHSPMQTDNLFTIASISKLVGSVMAMKLIEEGKFSLDDTVFDLLPDYPNTEQAKRLTIRHLLSNTSGLVDYAIEIDTTYIETGIAPTLDDYYAFFAKHDLLFEPGSMFAYSNSGFKLVALIIEEITGRTYAEELQRIINQPTGLDFTLISEAANDPEMSTYFDLEDTIVSVEDPWAWIYGDGGVTATAEQLAKFAFKWADGSIISQASFETMCTPPVLSSGLSSDYGLAVRRGSLAGERVIGHTGGNKSTMAMMVYFPERKLSVAVLDNTDGASNGAMVILGHVALAALDQPAINLTTAEVRDTDLSQYLGDYHQYGYVTLQPTTYSLVQYPDDHRLYRKLKGSDRKGQQLFYLGNHTFTYEPYTIDRIQFLMEDGAPRAYRVYWNGLFKRMGFRG